MVDGGGAVVPESAAVVRAHRRLDPDEELDHELFLQQVEIQTDAHDDPDALRKDLIAQRASAVAAARSAGLDLAAVPVDVLGGSDPVPTPDSRYARMIATYGEIARNGMTCGMHIHVEVDDRDAIRVVDGLRPWTPLLNALSANAPFFHGRDTGHASFRGVLWDMWPTAGAVDAFGDLPTYRRLIDTAIASGAAVDEHMVYLDSRIAESYPTVEIRVADVCTEVDDALVIAELSRAIVSTIVEDAAPTRDWDLDLLRWARWRARHDGLGGKLMDPVSGEFVPAGHALDSMLTVLEPALDEAGTTELVREGVHRLVTSGTGAARQRAVAATPPDLSAVMADIVHRTDPHHDREETR